MTIHAEILKKSGKPEFAVIPYEEFVAMKESLDDYEDLMDLRKAKQKTAKTVSIREAKKKLGL